VSFFGSQVQRSKGYGFGARSRIAVEAHAADPALRVCEGPPKGANDAELRASGATSLRAIASALNDRGMLTARGGKWFTASVRDVLARI
jgi:hypothetical protein